MRERARCDSDAQRARGAHEEIAPDAGRASALPTDPGFPDSESLAMMDALTPFRAVDR